MSRLVLLDAGPLGLLTNPRDSLESSRCHEWLNGITENGGRVVVPEGADYEVRRELFRAGRRGGLNRPDNLARQFGFVPITSSVWRRAAELWAWSRNHGYTTAKDSALDFDIVLAAQAQLAAEDGYDVTVATTNAAHLSPFIDARTWQAIPS